MMAIWQVYLDRLIATNALLEAYICSVHERTNQQQQATSHKHINPTDLRNNPMLYAVAIRNKACSRERSSSGIRSCLLRHEALLPHCRACPWKLLCVDKPGQVQQDAIKPSTFVRSRSDPSDQPTSLGAGNEQPDSLVSRRTPGGYTPSHVSLANRSVTDHFSQGFPHKLASSACSPGRLLGRLSGKSLALAEMQLMHTIL
jgi:hypothetical protein